MRGHIDDIIDACHAVFVNLPKRRRPSRTVLLSFARDLLLVASGLRLAHLIDAFGLEDGMHTDLFSTLRQTGQVTDVIFVSSSDLSQHFAVNALLVSGATYPDVILLPPKLYPRLSDRPFVVPEVDTALANISLASRLGHTHISISDMAPPSFILLTGLLLEYPVAYYPVEAQLGDGLRPLADIDEIPQLLGGLPLVVYTCFLVPSEAQKLEVGHSPFMKFSCPEVITRTLPDIPVVLETRLAPRLTKFDLTIRVEIQYLKMDKVAL